MPIDFEKVHSIFKGKLGALCSECGGWCEKSLISTFLPGEDEFVAKKMGMDVEEFRADYTMRVKFEGHYIYILKGGACPFLKDCHCGLEQYNAKPIQCLIYPGFLTAEKGKIRCAIDYEDCPMARKLPAEFKENVKKVCDTIKNDIPAWWIAFHLKYEGIYDYSKLDKLRRKPEITLSELENCIAKSNKH